MRYDHPWSWFPAVTEPSSRFFPGASFAATDGVTGYNDITPAHGCRLRRVRQRQDGAEGERSGSTCRAPASATWRTARTRRCGSLAATRRSAASSPRRRAARGRTTTGNFVPDCNLQNPLAQGPATTGSIDNCGQIDNLRFGQTAPSARTSIRACSAAGACVRPTGRSACRCSSRSSRVRRWRSATTVARSRSSRPAAR